MKNNLANCTRYSGSLSVQSLKSVECQDLGSEKIKVLYCQQSNCIRLKERQLDQSDSELTDSFVHASV